MTECDIQLERPDSEPARTILRAYFAEIVTRYQGRPATEPELDAVVLEFPSHELHPPGGLLWLAGIEGSPDWPVGCVGLRILAGGLGEVTRLFVAARYRNRGIAKHLMRELEDAARDRGLLTLRLNARHDLVEARSLYLAIGFREVAPFNDEPYAEHWFERRLDQRSSLTPTS